MLMKMQKNRNSHSLPAGRHNGTQPLWNMVWHVIKLNTVFTCNPAITLLGIYPMHLKIYIHTNNCMRMFTEALFIIARSKKSQQVNTFFKKKKGLPGTSLWSSGQDAVFSLQGAQVQSLVREVPCHTVQPKKKKSSSTQWNTIKKKKSELYKAMQK